VGGGEGGGGCFILLTKAVAAEIFEKTIKFMNFVNLIWRHEVHLIPMIIKN